MAGDILILGSSGFVGRALVRSLQEQEYNLHCISTHPVEFRERDNIHVYTSTLDDEKTLRRVLPQCESVVYLASHSNPGFSALKPFLEVKYNLLPGLRFLEILQDYNHVKLLYLSSGGAIYGSSAESGASEKNPLTPISYYGAGKASMEKFILAYCTQSQGSATILRPTNFYGPGQPFKKGFGIIPAIFHHILKEKPLTIWGDGETVRDYLYIDDFVQLCSQFLHKNEFSPGLGTIYNVGAEVGTSINAVCGIIEEVTGRTLLKEYQKARMVDVPNSSLDCSKIKQDLKWIASTDLRNGLERTWNWYRTQES